MVIHNFGLKIFPDQYRWSRRYELKSSALSCESLIKNYYFYSYLRLTQCVYVINRFEEYDGVVVNSANISKPKDVLFKGRRFEWNLWRRFLMNEISSRTLQEFIFKYNRRKPILITILLNDSLATTARFSKITSFKLELFSLFSPYRIFYYHMKIHRQKFCKMFLYLKIKD